MAKRRGGGSDDAEDGAVGQREARRGRGAFFDDGRDFSEARLEPRQHLIARKHFGARPLGGAANVHVFDEAHFGGVGAAKLDELGELVIIHSANDHRVEFGAGKAGALRGSESRKDAGMLVTLRHGEKTLGAQRVQT